MHFINHRIRRGNSEIDGPLHFDFQLSLNLHKRGRIGELLLHQPSAEILDGVALRSPQLLFLLGAVIFTIDVAHMMAVITIGIAHEERRAFPFACPAHKFLRDLVHGAHILAVANVIDSAIPRVSDGALYTHAGPEIGVASTKCFTK